MFFFLSLSFKNSKFNSKFDTLDQFPQGGSTPLDLCLLLGFFDSYGCTGI